MTTYAEYSMKSKADPFVDFDEYVNGEWKKNTIIPDDQVEWGTFNILYESNLKKVVDILNEMSLPKNGVNVNVNVNNKSFGELFKSLLRTDNMHTDMLQLVLRSKYLWIIDDIKTIDDLGYVLGFLMMIDVKPFINIGASDDPKNEKYVRLTMYTPNLSLPDKEYYTDPKLKDFVALHKKTIKNIMTYAYKNGMTQDEIVVLANDASTIETLIASMLKPIEQRREIDKLYFKTTPNEFITNMGVLDSSNGNLSNKSKIGRLWKNIFEFTGLISAEELIIYDIDFFIKLSVMLETVNIEKLKNYIKYVVTRDLGSKINHQIDKISFGFFGTKLLGQTVMSDRVKVVVQYLNETVVGEIIGREYAAKYFDDDSKAQVSQMIECVKNQMEETLISLEWMSLPTKNKALAKLKNFKTKIGYPNEWTDYSQLNAILEKYIVNDNITSGKLIDAICQLKMYSFKTNITDIIDKPKNENKWSMNVHEVNAYYDLHRNEMVFPAGILQPPVFDKNQSSFKNYGSIGTIIGHELIHGYDDQGRKFDQNGNTSDWWTVSDINNYKLVTNQIVEQYESYNVNGKKINGQLTLGENIADIGGIDLAFKAVIDCCKKNNISVSIENKREFFTSYAQLWKINTRPEKLLMQVLTDPHSPNKYRIWTVRNFDAFYEAFRNLSKIDKATISSLNNGKDNIMYLSPDKRIKMW